jgi:hypothetical protein
MFFFVTNTASAIWIQHKSDMPEREITFILCLLDVNAEITKTENSQKNLCKVCTIVHSSYTCSRVNPLDCGPALWLKGVLQVSLAPSPTAAAGQGIQMQTIRGSEACPCLYRHINISSFTLNNLHVFIQLFVFSLWYSDISNQLTCTSYFRIRRQSVTVTGLCKFWHEGFSLYLILDSC